MGVYLEHLWGVRVNLMVLVRSEKNSNRCRLDCIGNIFNKQETSFFVLIKKKGASCFTFSYVAYTVSKSYF